LRKLNKNYSELETHQLKILSQDGKDFISKLLDNSADDRPTAKTCLQDPWLKIDNEKD